MKIGIEDDNVRLDRFLKNNCKDNTLSEIFKAIRLGYVKVNGKKQKENYRLQENDEIEIRNLSYEKKDKKYNKYNDKYVFYEDENYLIINKPSNIAMHKGSKNEKGLAELYNVDFANRLDKKTSGLVVACKNKKTLRYVTQLIRNKEFTKKYYAYTKNNKKYNLNDEFEIKNNLLVTDDKVIISKDGKESISKFKVIDIKDTYIKFEVDLVTGRKHQIRVQLASIGLPIIGDDKYGPYKKEDELKLECYYIKFSEYEFCIK